LDYAINKTIIEKIVLARTMPIRKENDSVFESLVVKITAIGKIYGSYKESQDGTIDKCIDILINHFGKLCVNEQVNEIEIAFELASAKKINVDTTVYGGQFNATIFGNVLTAYVEYRNNLLKTFDYEIEKVEKMEKEKANFLEPTKFEYAKNKFWELVEKYKDSTEKEKDIACQSVYFESWIFQDLDDAQNGIFPKVSDEIKEKLLENTRKVVFEELCSEKSNPDKEKRNNAKMELESLDKGFKSADYLAKCRSVYFRFLLMYFISHPQEVKQG
jgi:hypothetical protein